MTNPASHSPTRIHPAYLFSVGLCMGAADVVPGVSGGTMAFVLGVYPNLLQAIRCFDFGMLTDFFRLRWRNAFHNIPWRFLLPLGLGIVTAVGTLAELLSHLLQYHESLLFAFFFGLIIASIVALAGRLKWSLPAAATLLLGAAFAFWLVGLVPADPGHSPIILFGSGAIAICAMILPGISGSFILLILGQYTYCVTALTSLIDAARDLDFAKVGSTLLQVILPAGLGAVTGLLLFTRLLSWLLNRYYTTTVALLVGFMVGSLRRIWPYKQILSVGLDRHGKEIPLEWRNILPTEMNGDVLLAIALAGLGFVFLSLIDHIYDRSNPVIVAIMSRAKQAQ
ncbi:MAG: DUF368 domain-containing protein [Pirellulaceae bacterium]|nr:DUF368 domain-containing protein [Pirellulaceae bacterium]